MSYSPFSICLHLGASGVCSDIVKARKQNSSLVQFRVRRKLPTCKQAGLKEKGRGGTSSITSHLAER